jgi:hypothetical protein
MTYLAALDVLATHPHIWRFRQLCDHDHEDTFRRDGARAHVIRLATGEPPPVPHSPLTTHHSPLPAPCCGGNPYGD